MTLHVFFLIALFSHYFHPFVKYLLFIFIYLNILATPSGSSLAPPFPYAADIESVATQEGHSAVIVDADFQSHPIRETLNRQSQ